MRDLTAFLLALLAIAAFSAAALVCSGCFRGASIERTPATWKGCIEVGSDGGAQAPDGGAK